MRTSLRILGLLAAIFAALLLLHLPFLRLPYFWDEAGYYIPASLDFYHGGHLIPHSTLPEGHPPLVMVFIGLAWKLFGYSPLIARSAMTLIAAATVTSIYVLGRRIANAEIAFWTALLLALSPMFFAQTTLVHLDLAAALFTTLAVLFFLDGRPWLFALAASLAVLSKETSVIMLPIAWVCAWRNRRLLAANNTVSASAWIALVVPLVPLGAWSIFYHHATGFWTGNQGYLSYNLYSTLSPVRVFWSLARRLYELFFSGFQWLLTLSVPAGIWWGRKYSPMDPKRLTDGPPWRAFMFLTGGIVAAYLVLLSIVGGAILPRYLLPVIPMFYLALIAMILRLPRRAALAILSLTAIGFVAAWFINPPYPFPFEDNLAYADFIHLHQDAATFLGRQGPSQRILTAWPATDELSRPFLGYVNTPLRIVPAQGFAAQDLIDVAPDSFDLFYLYSRRWEPPGNWLQKFPEWLRIQGRYFDYHPQVDTQEIVDRFHLRLIARMEKRGQWVEIYSH